MTKEVKEILEEFLKEKGAYSLRYSFNGDLAYSQEQMLKDYITNLQEENETLKKEMLDFNKQYDYLKDKFHARADKSIKYAKEIERLKNREKELKYFNDILENKEIELLKENHELKETIEELQKEISDLEMNNLLGGD